MRPIAHLYREWIASVSIYQGARDKVEERLDAGLRASDEALRELVHLERQMNANLNALARASEADSPRL